jgi:hypothetical protein
VYSIEQVAVMNMKTLVLFPSSMDLMVMTLRSVVVVVVIVRIVDVDFVSYYYFDISRKKNVAMMKKMKRYLIDVLHFSAYIEMIFELFVEIL